MILFVSEGRRHDGQDNQLERVSHALAFNAYYINNAYFGI